MLFEFLLTLLGPMYSEPSVTNLLFYALVRGLFLFFIFMALYIVFPICVFKLTLPLLLLLLLLLL